ncbi:MAG: hypothetical protein QM754_18965 [Tepidisphaeraceae bacterium]
MSPAEPAPLSILAESEFGDVFVPLILTLLGLALLIGLVAVVRKKMMSGHAAGDGDLSLGGLRELVRQGKMTQQEYDAAKAQIVAAHHRRAERDALEVKPATPAKGGQGGVDSIPYE